MKFWLACLLSALSMSMAQAQDAPDPCPKSTAFHNANAAKLDALTDRSVGLEKQIKSATTDELRSHPEWLCDDMMAQVSLWRTYQKEYRICMLEDVGDDEIVAEMRNAIIAIAPRLLDFRKQALDAGCSDPFYTDDGQLRE